MGAQRLEDVRKMRGAPLLLLQTYCVLLSLCAGSIAHADQNVVSTGASHPECSSAFEALPIDENGNPVEKNSDGENKPPPTIEGHFSYHREKYIKYDEKCLKDWDNLAEDTKNFLRPRLGVIFLASDNTRFEDTPYCSVFRIRQTIVVTARHCETESDLGFVNSYAVFMDNPHDNIRFMERIGQIGDVYSSSDLTDYVIWKTSDDKKHDAVFNSSDIRRVFLDNQAIAIVAFSIAAWYVDDNRKKENWLNYIRFSRVNASKIWRLEEVKKIHGNTNTNDECLYHRAPTFSGMSGAPIVGLRIVRSGEKELFIIGIHLRNGTAVRLEGDECGDVPTFNVGIKIPEAIAERLTEQ
ncbi:hypothetical protein [Jiella avicenniae]|uniref:Trypsin n=1 Tax=Jiella avicenniae TaxID=2907202 RepID=A0A9X1T7I1_9HYPH|nr:hypothetical protein [Jiella avicenniae]MCE7030924.1 hypothetical protein [Jiella avicenniae]